MLFNSLHFIIFFPIVVILYFSIPYKYRWILLLISSYYFYMCWKAEYIILILISTLIDYFASLMMGKTQDKKKRLKYLILSLLSNLGLLFSFKYFNFFNNSIRAVFDCFNIFYNVPSFKVLLPVGISFYTFQTLSYTIDVYRGEREPEKHLGIFAVYVAFFPQLVAGPIERSNNLLPQFFEKHDFDYKRVADGLKLMVWGFFKKVVIADRLAIIVDKIYNNVSDYNGITLLIATYFFAFQIFCDFSGYSDIAIGSAQIMGYRLMTNFKRPYFSKSISEFWRRWHISLSSWFRDYLYIPLGGNRVGKYRWCYNIIIVFLVTGLWHGANWTFVIWGALHGFYYLFSRITQNIRDKIRQILKIDNKLFFKKIIQVFITFHLVVFSWIFFRANTVNDAFKIINKILLQIKNVLYGFYYLIINIFLIGKGYGVFRNHLGKELKIIYKSIKLLLDNNFIIVLVAILLMEVMHLIQRKGSVRDLISKQHFAIRWSSYYFIVLIILFYGVFGAKQFIYFQF